MPPFDRRAMPLYTISVASQLCRLPVHTLRWLESNELFQPARTQGRQRLFSDSDIEFLMEVARLLERKVNLAGIRVILEIKERHHLETISLEITAEE
ncbi:MAG: MerR family DNA-binding transcriptional regulator [Elusimicrobia bacterium CG_4_10_14_0_2_um_filter_63_34]|nr:MAG: MerR family DNA-binding transcriptional regulator [Elusimicrobia bacterium CG_4_10_14_0_2_um_filter_63_34]